MYKGRTNRIMKREKVTSKDMRTLIIWAMHEIDEYKDFIKLCEKKIKSLREERLKK